MKRNLSRVFVESRHGAYQLPRSPKMSVTWARRVRPFVKTPVTLGLRLDGFVPCRQTRSRARLKDGSVKNTIDVENSRRTVLSEQQRLSILQPGCSIRDCRQFVHRFLHMESVEFADSHTAGEPTRVVVGGGPSLSSPDRMIPSITCGAHVTAQGQLILDPQDPFRYGIRV